MMLFTLKTTSAFRTLWCCGFAFAALAAGSAHAEVDLGPRPPLQDERGGGPRDALPADEDGDAGSAPPSRQFQPDMSPRRAPPSSGQIGARGAGPSGAQGEPGMMGLPFPKSKAEIPKTLESLYAFLATEGDKRKGGEISGAIQRLWRLEGGDTVVMLIDRAEGFSQINKTEMGLPFADAAVDLAPDYADAWAHRAYLNYRMQNYKAALGDLRRALALEPNHFRALDAMAKILVLIGEKQAAFKAYEKLLSIHPNIEGGQTAYDELKNEVDGRGI